MLRLTAVMIAWLCLVSMLGLATAGPTGTPTFTAAELEKCLAKIDDGYDLVRPVPKGVSRFVLKHRSQTIYVEHISTANQALVRLWAVVREKATLVSVNAWNRDRYFGKAYLNRDDDVIFEACLPVNRGMNDELFREWVEAYTQDLIEFKQFLRR